jgi:hypothetical protein
MAGRERQIFSVAPLGFNHVAGGEREQCAHTKGAHGNDYIELDRQMRHRPGQTRIDLVVVRIGGRRLNQAQLRFAGLDRGLGCGLGHRLGRFAGL